MVTLIITNDLFSGQCFGGCFRELAEAKEHVRWRLEEKRGFTTFLWEPLPDGHRAYEEFSKGTLPPTQILRFRFDETSLIILDYGS